MRHGEGLYFREQGGVVKLDSGNEPVRGSMESALNYVASLGLRFSDSIGLELSREAPYAVPHVGCCGRGERNTLLDPIRLRLLHPISLL